MEVGDDTYYQPIGGKGGFVLKSKWALRPEVNLDSRSKSEV